jgi:L-threonylcarbamoyladenylate synthase
MTSVGISTDVALASQTLLQGGVIGLPTETVYGLAAVALNEDAVYRVFDTKGRPRNHPLIVHLAPSMDYREWGVFNDFAASLAHELWPGPLTLLVPRTSLVPDWVTGGRDTVALRVPNHPIAQDLLTRVNAGIVAPSANKFGRVSPTTAQHVLDDLGDNVDLILQGGTCQVGVESTIVECTDVFQILRPGQISADVIRLHTGVMPDEPSGDSRAPGMLSSHYAPTAQVIIADTRTQADSIASSRGSTAKTRVLHFEDVNTYAERLYDELRTADRDGCDVVIAVRAPSSGVGEAVNDRLEKAAAHR